MRTKIPALALLLATASAVAFYPAKPGKYLLSERPRIEVVFVLDTTASMGGLIEAAQEKIWSIASTMAAAQPAPLIRMGLVAYRDRGDEYVTRVVDLSGDLDSVHASLMDFRADGGGDAPESVNRALHDAVHSMSWSAGDGGYKAIFLVGDAPPQDYRDEVKYPEIVSQAVARGIVVNAIQCGDEPETSQVWRRIAQLGDGVYFGVGQSGDAVAIDTPFDGRIAGLAAELDGTRLYYGAPEARARQQARLEAAAKLHAGSSAAAQARRGAFNASPEGAANFLGDGELVEEVASGRMDLSKIDKSMLPESLRPLAPAERRTAVMARAEKRARLQREIQALSEQRQEYMREKVAAAGGAEASLDEKIYEAIRDQAAKKGFEYKSATADY